MPDWTKMETLERLLAAVIACNNGATVDNMQVARYFNDTFDTIENRTRIYKKQAQALIQDAHDTGRINQNMRKRREKTTPRKPRAEKSAGDLDAVSTGRVTKKKSPTKKPATVVKEEEVFGSIKSPDFGALPPASTSATFQFEDLNFDAEAADYDWGNGIA